MQSILGEIDGRFEKLELPDPDAWLLDDLRWGSFEHPLTPAFWVSQAWLAGSPEDAEFRLGKTLAEEVTFCLLGGYGAPAEVGLAAAERVCTALAIGEEVPSRQQLERFLREPFMIRGQPVRYRFAAQRAKYLAGALALLTEFDEASLDDVTLRDALCKLPGIGPKTASWVVRNRRGSDRVAILDVHIVRACQVMSLFPDSLDPVRHYLNLERRFLAFCAATQTRASNMDAVMWATMRKLSRLLLQQLVDANSRFEERRPMHQKRE